MLKSNENPRLYGLANSNRDFAEKASWGKNQFNSSFPAALCCYLHSKNKKAVYLSINNGSFSHTQISIKKAFQADPLDKNTYYAFESAHSPFQKYVIGSLPRTDLVIQQLNTGKCLAGIEVKLTALPDNTTCECEESALGSEIVVRPDTIVYLACSLAKGLGRQLNPIFNSPISVSDWSDADNVIPHINDILNTLKQVYKKLETKQSPFLLQPIWKTNGKSPELSSNCLDVFFWSDAGFLAFITEIANGDSSATKITRQTRTSIWLYKMLNDIVLHKKFNHQQIIDNLSFNTKNDKAFASSGNVTNRYMKCDRLKKPVIKKSDIKKIILGGGQTLLSPERRFDAIIYNSPELFK